MDKVSDYGPSPISFTADTLNKYSAPVVKPLEIW